jgi:hypothetical protein
VVHEIRIGTYISSNMCRQVYLYRAYTYICAKWAS